MALLEIKGLRKKFGGLEAINDCTFSIGEKSIVSIIGPNGAGKTTLFNMISGLIEPTQGSVVFNGVTTNGLKSFQIARLGIGRAFQDSQLFEDMTALQNVEVGRHSLGKAGILGSLFRTKSQRREENEILEKAKEYMRFLKVDMHRNTLAKNLSCGDQKRVEIARALMLEPRLLLLDEPNSGMNEREVMELIEAINRINEERGITVLCISHHMKFVQDISHHVIVLNYGRIISEGKPQDVVNNKYVMEAYLGKAESE